MKPFITLCILLIWLSPFHLSESILPQHTQGIIHTCKKCLEETGLFPSVQDYIQRHHKNYPEVTVKFDEKTIHPYLSTLDAHGTVISMYDISTLSLPDILLLLRTLQFHVAESRPGEQREGRGNIIEVAHEEGEEEQEIPVNREYMRRVEEEDVNDVQHSFSYLEEEEEEERKQDL